MQFITRHWRLWLIAIIAVGGALWLGELAWRRWVNWGEDDFNKEILAASKRHGVDPALIKAVVWRETKFRPGSRGKAGEVGLMQIMAATAQDWAEAERITFFRHEDLFDPAKNTQCGAWVLRRALHRHRRTDNPAAFALAEYNAGSGNVAKWTKGIAATNSAAFVKQIGFPSTRHYVITALERHQKYRRRFSTE